MENTTLYIDKYEDGQIICIRFTNDKKEKSFSGNKKEFLKWLEDKVV